MEFFKKSSYNSGGNFPSSAKISYILGNVIFQSQKILIFQEIELSSPQD